MATAFPGLNLIVANRPATTGIDTFFISAILAGMVDVSQFHHRQYRSLTVGVMLLIPCCLLLAKWQQVRKKREAVAAIEDGGGKVEYGEAHGPRWLRNLLGDDWFIQIRSVSLGPSATGMELEHLRLAQVQSLSLSFTKITDAGLERLNGLLELHKLHLSHTKITDAGLERLKGLTQLQRLSLDFTTISDAGLEHLKGLDQLQWLSLDDTPVTDVAVVPERAGSTSSIGSK